MKIDIEKIIELGNSKIDKFGWKIYPDDIKYYGGFVRLFYQSKKLVDTGVASEDDDDMIYGIGIFLVNLNTLEFHKVSSIDDVVDTVNRLNSLL